MIRKRVTIKDIARLAGVSHGTVSNVLNGRGNVSVEKIKAVKRAARQMGYQINAQAQSLRTSKRSGIALILPDINAERYHQLYRGLQQSLQPQDAEVLDLYLTHDRPPVEMGILQALAARSYKAIITISCLKQSDIYYQTLKLPPQQILFVYRHPHRAQIRFSLDFYQAGQALATLIARHHPRRVGILCEPLSYTSSQRFIEGMKNALAKLTPPIQLMINAAATSECYAAAFSFFEDTPPDLLIAQDSERGRCLTQAAWLGSSGPCPVLIQLSDNEPAIIPGQYCYQMEYARLGMEIAHSLREQTSSSDNRILANRGFALNAQPVSSPSATAEMLNMLILPSPSTDALKKLLPHFYRQSGIKVNLAIYPYDKVFEILSSLELHPYYDLLRIDMACLPWFAQQTLKPLTEIDPTLTALFTHFSAEISHHFSLIDGKAYALPFDASIQLLFYRRDLFDDVTLRRMFYETTGRDLHIPGDFVEYDRIAAFFSAMHQPGNSQRPSGSSTTLGSAALIATEFLLRYYASGGRLIHPDRPAQLIPPLAIATLKQYLQQLSFSTPLNSEWWNAAVDQFAQGQLAMLIMYRNLFNGVARSALSPAIGYAPVPGNMPQMGGGSLGMSRYSERAVQVSQFFHWLYSPAITEQLVLLGGNSVHQSLCQNQRILHLYPWLNLLRDNPDHGIRETRGFQGELFNLRHAEIIIGQGVANAVNKIMDAEQAVRYINQRLLTETAFRT